MGRRQADRRHTDQYPPSAIAAGPAHCTTTASTRSGRRWTWVERCTQAIQLWPLDHGDAWQNTHCTEPFVESTEIDQTYDGFPLDFRIVVSADGQKWDEVAKRDRYRRPAVGPDDSDRKAKDVTGPERFEFEKTAVLPLCENRIDPPAQNPLFRQVRHAVGRDRGRPRSAKP